MASLSRCAAFSAMSASISGVILGSGAGWVEATRAEELVDAIYNLGRDTDLGAQESPRQMASDYCSPTT